MRTVLSPELISQGMPGRDAEQNFGSTGLIWPLTKHIYASLRSHRTNVRFADDENEISITVRSLDE
jgi:hypothetical protein